MRNKDNGSEIIFHNGEEPLRIECRHFLECVATRRTPASGGKSGLEVVKVLEKATTLLNTQRSLR